MKLAAALLIALGLAASAPAAPPDGFVFVAGGDMIGPYHPMPGADDKGFQAVVSLFRNADIGYANQEGSIFDLETFKGFPAAETGGGFPLQPAAMAGDIEA